MPAPGRDGAVYFFGDRARMSLPGAVLLGDRSGFSGMSVAWSTTTLLKTLAQDVPGNHRSRPTVRPQYKE